MAMTASRKLGTTSSMRLGWNLANRGGRTWWSISTAPTPRVSGLSIMWAPEKYSASSAARIRLFLKFDIRSSDAPFAAAVLFEKA
jgi:hypothetical protein